MKEFSYDIDNIFSGLIPTETKKKNSPGLIECHNIQPTEDDYIIHDEITDLNSTGTDWNNTQDLVDYWTDHEDDDWIDDSDDEFTDI